MKKHHRDDNNCLNCGAELQGKFCHACGQENLHLKESFGHVMAHAIGDYFHFDEKFFHTLKPLLFSPGKLTIDYNEGKRMQYLHPIRMYIFISVVYFLLVFQNGRELVQINNVKKPVTKAQVLDSVNKAIDVDVDMDKADKAAAKRIVDKSIPNYNINLVSPTKVKGKNDVHSTLGAHILDSDTSYDGYLKRQKTLDPKTRDNFFGRYVAKKYFAWKKAGGTAKETFEEALKHNIPKMMFFLLPFFALLLKFNFRKNHKFYIEHLIYSFHLHCFLFLFLSIVLILQMLIPNTVISTVVEWLYFVAFLVIAFYVYKSLRVFYHRSRLATISKMTVITIIYFFFFGIGFICLAAITAATSV